MKKFITIALAVAVLFSFAACQPNNSYDVVQAVELGYTAVGKTVYLEGEEFDPSGYTFVLVNNVGQTSTIDASSLTFSALPEPADNDGTVTVSYMGTLTAAIPVTVEAIASLDVVIPESATAYAKIGGGSGSAEEPYTGEITVTAYNNDETLSRELDASEYTATYDSTTASGEATVTVTYGTVSDETATIAVIEDTIVDFSVAPSQEYYYINGSKALATNFDLTAIWASGEDTDASYSEFGFEDLAYDSTAVSSNSSTFAVEDVGKTWTLPLYLRSDESKTHNAELFVSNTYASVTSVSPDSLTVTPGSTITSSQLTVIASTQLAEGATASAADVWFSVDSGATWVQSYMVSHYPASESLTLTVGVSMNGQTRVTAGDTVAVTISNGNV